MSVRPNYARSKIWRRVAPIGIFGILVSACGSGQTGDGNDSGDAVAEDTETAPAETEDAGETYEYRIATAEGIGTSMETIFDEFVEQASDCSDGRLVGEHFPAGQLGDYSELIDGNRIGTYEITSGGFDTEGEIAPDLSGLALGYLFEDSAHVDRFAETMLEDVSGRMNEATGVSVVGIGMEGTRHLVSTKPVTSLSELEGLKLRTPQFEIPVGLWTALGAQPTPVPFSDVYSALETGVVDGAEGAIPSIEAMGFHEPASNITLTHHWINLKAIRVNTEWLESLPDELQDCIWEEAGVVAERQRGRAETESAEVRERLEDDGVEFHEVDDLDAWREAAAPYTEEYLEKYPDARPFIEEVRGLSS